VSRKENERERIGKEGRKGKVEWRGRKGGE
jgi:hypothetical protein